MTSRKDPGPRWYFAFWLDCCDLLCNSAVGAAAGVTVQVLSVTSGKEEGELLARAGAALHAAVVPGMWKCAHSPRERDSSDPKRYHGSHTRVLRLTSALGFWSVWQRQTFIFTFQLLFSRCSITRSKDRRKNTIDGGGLRSLLVFVHGDVKNSFFLVQEHIADLLFIPIEDLLTFKNGGAWSNSSESTVSDNDGIFVRKAHKLGQKQYFLVISRMAEKGGI